MTSAVSRHWLCKKQECFDPLLSYNGVMTAWLQMVKAQVEGFRCVRGRRGRTGDAKATGDSKYQLGSIYAHKWHLSWSRALFWLKRDLETTICNLRYCRLNLFVYGWLIPMLISWVLRKSTNHWSNLSQKKNKYDENNLKAVLSARAACLH